MTLTGNWMRRNAEMLEPMYGPWTVVDKRHAEREDIDPRRKEAFEGVPQQPGPDSIDTYASGDSTQVTDRTPISHAGIPRNPNMTLEELGAVHSMDHGATWANTRTYPRLMKWGDDIRLFLQQDHGPPPAAVDPGTRTDLIRGLNAFPANNPGQEMYGGEGWRRATWQSRRDEHRLAKPTRHHRWRIVQRWVAAAPVNRAQSDTGVYTGLHWDGLSRSIKNKFDMPRMRRQPGFIDENVITDGTEQAMAANVGDFF